MTENEFLLHDRIAKIKSIIEKYGEDNFYISYSGGKDSTVVHELFDMAVPGNRIPRVYANTGIEMNMIRDFVKSKAEKDERFVIIKPQRSIKATLEEYGYPFKSKRHSAYLSVYQRKGKLMGVKQYLGEREDKEPWQSERSCPAILRYQFTQDFTMRISDKCCLKMKEEPLQKWGKENKRPYAVIGIMASEGGRREGAQCLVVHGGKLKAFQPLAPMTKEWEEWFIEEHGVEICGVYKPPYNFPRTGCKGCPFTIKLQEQLDTFEQYFPAERRQCEIIWKPVYDEYRRLGYRLRKTEDDEQLPGQMEMEEWLKTL